MGKKGGRGTGRGLGRDLVEHLTQRQFEGYRRRQLEVAELLSVCEHLDECEACRRRAESAADGAFFALRSDIFGEAADVSSTHATRAHLTAEQTTDYVDGKLSGETLQTVSDHLSSCEHCAFAVEDLRAFGDEVAPSLEREYQPAGVPSSVPSVTGRRRRWTF